VLIVKSVQHSVLQQLQSTVHRRRDNSL